MLRASFIVLYIEMILLVITPRLWENTFAFSYGSVLGIAALAYITLYFMFNFNISFEVSYSYNYKSLFKEGVDSVNRLEFIRNTNANVNMIFDDGEHILMKAINAEDFELVKYLVYKGANINSECKLGFSVLSHAVETGNQDIVKFLLLSGCIPTKQSMSCAYNGPGGLDPRMVKLLREVRAD